MLPFQVRWTTWRQMAMAVSVSVSGVGGRSDVVGLREVGGGVDRYVGRGRSVEWVRVDTGDAGDARTSVTLSPAYRDSITMER